MKTALSLSPSGAFYLAEGDNNATGPDEVDALFRASQVQQRSAVCSCTNLSAAEVLAALEEKGYERAQLPSVRTMRDILNRMNYRLKRIQKGKPLKKTKDTDAIFANVQSARRIAGKDPDTLEISIDTKTKVKLGDYSQWGKNQDR